MYGVDLRRGSAKKKENNFQKSEITVGEGDTSREGGRAGRRDGIKEGMRDGGTEGGYGNYGGRAYDMEWVHTMEPERSPLTG